ncbi:hypothetical protein P872_00480 [Rhodonellum psychrophilum GCM71 = DSM 17998]|uniref:Uncharacterized protein n=2 Tax=Rhodonellum TaxID=336827 RepID=U5C514_9BACT|nr:hypothetical protein P872_00480 [Rhodonellum psychrophilum GCM71 = DSM 17998]SDY39565.1 hypothetical protein SAMN05444412_10118 [Rhodonellum ikkaensis]
MVKLIPIVIEGQKIIQLSQLRIDQANDLRCWLPGNQLRNYFFQGLELHECILFETYEYWFRSNHILSRNYETILDF